MFLNALRYNAAVAAWGPPAVIYTDTSSSTQRTQITFRSDGSAVATYIDSITDVISTKLFDGLAWLPEAIAIPDDPLGPYYETTADGLDMILAFSDNDDVAFATWLREPAP